MSHSAAASPAPGSALSSGGQVDEAKGQLPYAIDNAWNFNGHAYKGLLDGPAFERVISDAYGMDFTQFFKLFYCFIFMFAIFPETPEGLEYHKSIHFFLMHKSFFSAFYTTVLSPKNMKKFCRLLNGVQINALKFRTDARHANHKHNPFYIITDKLKPIQEFLNGSDITTTFSMTLFGKRRSDMNDIINEVVEKENYNNENCSLELQNKVIAQVFEKLNTYFVNQPPQYFYATPFHLIDTFNNFVKHIIEPMTAFHLINTGISGQKRAHKKQQKRDLAVAMALHDRLGSRSQLRHVPRELLAHIADESYYRK